MYMMFCALPKLFWTQLFLPNDERLVLEGYNLIRVDHPNNVKRGGICLYLKSCLATRVCNISKLNECAIIEVILNNKKGYIISLYRSSSQSSDEFDEFLMVCSTDENYLKMS